MKIVGGPWPERIGLDCTDVTDRLDPELYPRHGMADDEIIVLIEHDPHDRPGHPREWTCCLHRADVE